MAMICNLVLLAVLAGTSNYCCADAQYLLRGGSKADKVLNYEFGGTDAVLQD